MSYDLLVRTQTRVPPSSSPIVLIGVTEDDIQTLGRWPLTDDMLADLLEDLIHHNPRAIGIDIYRDLAVPPGTRRLTSLLEQDNRIIAVEKVGSNLATGVPAPPVLRGTDRVGFNNIVLDPDGRVRRTLLFVDDGETVYYAFGLRLALLHLAQEGILPQPGKPDPQFLRLGSTTLAPLEPYDGGYAGADTRGYQVMLDYREGGLPFPVYSLAAVKDGSMGAAAIRDKIVIVGVMAESVKDIFFTPYDSHLSQSPGLSGPVIHAHQVSQLLATALDDVTPISFPGERQEALWLLVLSLLGGLVGRWIRSVMAYALFACGGLAVLVGTAYVAFSAGWWIPFAPQAVAWLTSMALATAYVMSHERAEHRVLMQLFSKHVSPEVAETIWREREQVLAGGRLRPHLVVGSVLFSDIKGFTSISERLDPEDLMEWLNAYMASMTRIVMKHGGIVDDYAGDGLKADFGVPVPRTDEESICRDARNAVDCALAMGVVLEEINARFRRDGLPAVSIRVGVNTGPIVVGTLGSADRLKYTSIGDAVNVASRLEGLKDASSTPNDRLDSSCRVLVSGATFNRLNGEYESRYLGNFNLKGKTREAAVYQITGRPSIERPNSKARKAL